MLTVMLFVFLLIVAPTYAISKSLRRTKFAAILAIVIGLMTTFWIQPILGFWFYQSWFWVFLFFGIGVVLGATKQVKEGKMGERAEIPVEQEELSKGWRIHRLWLMSPLSIIAILLFLAPLTSMECMHAKAYHNLIGEIKVASTSDMPMANIKNIRLTARETALAFAKLALGHNEGEDVLSAQLQIDENSGAIQEVNGQLWWIFPLDFRGFWSWWQRGTIPGYVRVSAQDPLLGAELVTKDADGKQLKIKYTPRGWLKYWIDRKAYYKCPTMQREDRTFEVDEKWRPYYTYSLTKPEIGFSGYVTKGVIIADAQTGKIEMTIDKIPDWVDRVRPIEQTWEQVKWWGTYGEGWMNANLFSGNKVKIPTHKNGDMWFVRLGDEKYWYTGMTSTNTKEDSIVGMMFVEARNPKGKAIYFPMQGSSEEGALKAVNAKLGANSSTWYAAQPIPYHIYGQPAFIIPVISTEGYFQQVAIVNIDKVTKIVVEPNLTLALQKYRQLLAQGGNAIIPDETAGLETFGPAKVLRKSDTIFGGEKTYFLYIEGAPSKIFASTGMTDITRLVALVNIDDMVTVKYVKTTEQQVAIEAISVVGLEGLQRR